MAKIKAATLLEVIVAMVIIMIVFVIATGIYTNVVQSAPSIKQQQGRAMASGMIQQSISENDWQDKTVMLDSIVLQKVVAPYASYPGLVQITVVATERGREIARIKQIAETNKAVENEANE